MTNIVLAALSTGIEGGFSVIYDISQDLWDSVSQVFDKSNVNKLLWNISGDSTATVDNMAPIETLATTRMTSEDIIANYNKVNPASADDNYSVSAKSYDAEIIVELGGLKWTPVFLSTTNEGKDNEPHDVILTLWLTDSSQLSGETYADGKTFDENGTSTWSSGFAPNATASRAAEVPDNLYGASYMHAVVLNNGGLYSNKTGSANSELVNYVQNEQSVFAKFTMTDGVYYNEISDFIVTPRQVAWQEFQSAIDSAKYWNNISNDAWSSEVTDEGFYSGDYNYAKKAKNDAWADDRLWIPSLSETGHGGKSLWMVSVNQRANSDIYWLRSAPSTGSTYACDLSAEGGDHPSINVSSTSAVRPALHLNLTAVAKSLNK